MPYKTIAVLLLGLAYATSSFSQKSVELICQPENGVFQQTSNKNQINYLLFHPIGSTAVDTLMKWYYLYYTPPASLPDIRDSLIDRCASGLFLECSFLDSTAVFLSSDDYIGGGYGLYIFKQHNNTWKELNKIRLPHTNYNYRGVLNPGEYIRNEKYEFISHDVLQQNTLIYDKVGSLIYENSFKYSVVSKRFKIDYENLKIIPLE